MAIAEPLDRDDEAPSAQSKASGSSFYLAMRILPRRQREAMYQVYAFCRAVDDIADSEGPRPPRLAQLERWQSDIDAIYAGEPPARVAELARCAHRFALQRADFQAVIDGMRMDIVADVRAPDVATLDLYCDRVASAVGRLSTQIFGLPRETGVRLSHHLGRALQLTNILRDIDEDAGYGRLYLPRETLSDAGVPLPALGAAPPDPAVVILDPRLDAACAPLVAQAREHFAQADAVMDSAPKRAVRAPRIMSVAYRGILEQLSVRGFTAPRSAVHVPRARLLALVLRHWWF